MNIHMKSFRYRCLQYYSTVVQPGRDSVSYLRLRVEHAMSSVISSDGCLGTPGTKTSIGRYNSWSQVGTNYYSCVLSFTHCTVVPLYLFRVSISIATPVQIVFRVAVNMSMHIRFFPFSFDLKLFSLSLSLRLKLSAILIASSRSHYTFHYTSLMLHCKCTLRAKPPLIQSYYSATLYNTHVQSKVTNKQIKTSEILFAIPHLHHKYNAMLIQKISYYTTGSACSVVSSRMMA